MDNSCFSGKAALVTGAGRGIGRTAVIALAKLNCTVYAVSKTEERLKALVNETPSGLVIPIVCDLSNWKGTRETLEKALPKNKPIHYLVNNAGVLDWVPLENITEEHVDSILNVNVKAVMNVTSMVMERMRLIEPSASGSVVGRGSIVNVSSVSAVRGLNEMLAYCTSKGAVDNMTRCMAVELGRKHKIRVNAVNPCAVNNDMGKWAMDDQVYLGRIPLHTIPDNNDVVRVIMFLLSDASSLVNGATVPVDGGKLCQD